MFQFDKSKYLEILRAQGVNAAITALHNDTNVWEIETFEGDQGYSPEMWNAFENVRNFSRELWANALAMTDVPATPKRS